MVAVQKKVCMQNSACECVEVVRQGIEPIKAYNGRIKRIQPLNNTLKDLNFKLKQNIFDERTLHNK